MAARLRIQRNAWLARETTEPRTDLRLSSLPLGTAQNGSSFSGYGGVVDIGVGL